MTEHECVFVEEQEPNGRLVLPPCIVCGITAMDALTRCERERDVARDYGERMHTNWRLSVRDYEECATARDVARQYVDIRDPDNPGDDGRWP